MIGVDMKALLEKCNVFCTQALHAAAGLTVNRSHYEVAVEHFLLSCLEDPTCDASLAHRPCTRRRDLRSTARTTRWLWSIFCSPA